MQLLIFCIFMVFSHAISSGCFQEYTDFVNADLSENPLSVANDQMCIRKCKENVQCKAITYRSSDRKCWLKSKENGDQTFETLGLKSANKECFQGCFQEDTDFVNADLSKNPLSVSNHQVCIRKCQENKQCKAITYRESDKKCWLTSKENGDQISHHPGLNSANKKCFQDSIKFFDEYEKVGNTDEMSFYTTNLKPRLSTTFLLHIRFSLGSVGSCRYNFNLKDKNDKHIYSTNLITKLGTMSTIEILVVITPKAYKVTFNGALITQSPVNWQRFDEYDHFTFGQFGTCLTLDLAKSYLQNSVEPSSFKIINRLGEISSSGLLIATVPTTTAGTVCGIVNKAAADLICKDLGHKCMAHQSKSQIFSSNTQASFSHYPVALTKISCPSSATAVNHQCVQIYEENVLCQDHTLDNFIECEVEASHVKEANFECLNEECSLVGVTAYETDLEVLIDDNPLTGINLWLHDISKEEDATLYFEWDIVVDHINVIISRDMYQQLHEAIGLKVEVLAAIDLDSYDDIEMIDTKCSPDTSNYRYPYYIGCQPTEYGYLRFDCPKSIAAAAVKIIPSIDYDNVYFFSELSILEIKVYGKKIMTSEERGDGMITNKNAQKLTTDFAPSEMPNKSPFVGEFDILRSSVPLDIEHSSENNFEVVWKPIFQGSIPYEVLMSSPTVVEDSANDASILGFLAKRGYLDYVLSEKKDASNIKTKSTVNSINVFDSIKMFQKFNGFPETGEVSKDTIGFIEEPRCGVGDIKYSASESKEEENLCFTAIADASVIDSNADNSCKKMTLNSKRRPSKTDICVVIPTPSRNSFIEVDRSYFIQVDIMFKPHGKYKWSSLAKVFGIWYNFDSTIGDSTTLGSGDLIQLYASEDEFGFQYQVLTEGLPTIKKLSNFTLSRVELARREFKIRIDVEEGGISYLLINGRDVGKMQYFLPIRSAAVLQHKFGVPELITARLCKRPGEVELRSRRDQSVSLHKWGSNTITYNFQNYSSALGEEKTRTAIKESLEVITKAAKLTFVEKARHEVVMLSFMFIKGAHADGLNFHGAGLEKAHAFSPVHSEIHFNDWEKFALVEENRATSMFYVSLHETGHALGLRHSDYIDAVMASGYKDNAFQIRNLHREDNRALRTQYPGDGSGSVQELSFIERNSDLSNRLYKYKPRIPLPRECISKIDAGFALGSKIYLISNTFVWQYTVSGLMKQGPPKRLSDVFANWNYISRAAFTVGKKVFLVSDSVVHVYRQFGSVFVIDKISTPNEVLNSKTSTFDFPIIRAAFTMSLANKEYSTVLVTGDSEYYKLTWLKSKLKNVEKVNDSTSLIGKRYGANEFNAAIPYIRKTKDGDTWELYKFDKKFVKSVQIHPELNEVRKGDPYQEVVKAFMITSWCPPKLKK